MKFFKVKLLIKSKNYKEKYSCENVSLDQLTKKQFEVKCDHSAQNDDILWQEIKKILGKIELY